MHPAPKGWFFLEAKDDDDEDPSAQAIIMSVCSEACAKSMWLPGPGERWTSKEPATSGNAGGPARDREAASDQPPLNASTTSPTSPGGPEEGEDYTKDSVIKQLCKMMARVANTIDPYAHEPCDCVCRDRSSREYRNSGKALTFMEQALSDAIIAYGNRPVLGSETETPGIPKATDEETLETLKSAFCSAHMPRSGKFANCLYCASMEQSAAISQIDYLFGPPNDQAISEYDVHCDPEEVVRRAKKHLNRE